MDIKQALEKLLETFSKDQGATAYEMFEGLSDVMSVEDDSPREIDYPKWVCDSCGTRANYFTCVVKYNVNFDSMKYQSKFTQSTYHESKCDVCGEIRMVTEPRDFFYPKFDRDTQLVGRFIEILRMARNMNEILDVRGRDRLIKLVLNDI